MGMEQMDAEVVETVAGVARLLRRAAELAWMRSDELLASADELLRRICVVGAPSRLLGLRVLVAELVWEANTGAGA